MNEKKTFIDQDQIRKSNCISEMLVEKKKEKRGFTCDRTKKKENWVWEGGSMIEE